MSLADEIDPKFEAAYCMGYFMAIADANRGTKVCGNVHFVSMNFAITNYFDGRPKSEGLKPDEVLAVISRQFPCAIPVSEPATSKSE